MTGRPWPKLPMKAVGMPATPLWTSNPALASCCLQELGASLLLKAHLRELPDLPRDLGEIRRSLVEKPRDVR